MSKKTTTDELILKKALQLFNNSGIEYVGVREIANELNIRVGNITYYFPTKDDIVLGIAEQLSQSNSGIAQILDQPTINDFIEMYRQLFHNQFRYRCLLISMVNLLGQNSKLAELYKSTELIRKKTILGNVNALINAGQLKKTLSKAEKTFIVSNISLISRFWLSEARLSYPQESSKLLIENYLGLIEGCIKPYASTENT